MRGDMPNATCSDCGVKGCAIKHWGDLSPGGAIGFFCWDCWRLRQEDAHRVEAGGEPKPFGYRVVVLEKMAELRAMLLWEAGA